MTKAVYTQRGGLFEPWLLCDHPHGLLLGARYSRAAPPEVLAMVPEGERALMESVPLARRGQWIAGRACARKGLLQVGALAPEVLSTDRGAPLASSGHSVSISHKAGFAVALITAVPGLTVGVDVEVPGARDGDLAAKVLTRAERDRSNASASPGVLVLRLFSAKEAVYKAVDPLLRRNLEFSDVEILPVGQDGGFEYSGVRVRTKKPEPSLVVQVTWLQAGPFLVTTATASRS